MSTGAARWEKLCERSVMIDSQKNIVTCIQEHVGLPGASGRLGKARCWCRQPGCAEELGEVEIAFQGRAGVVWGTDPESRYHVDVSCEEFKYAPVPALSAAQLQQSLNWAKSRGITFRALAATWFNAAHETLSLTLADARSFIAAKSQIQCFLHEWLGLSIDIVIVKSPDSPLIPGLVLPNGVPSLSHHTPDLVRCRPRSRRHPENDDLPLHLAQSSAPHPYGPLPMLICRSCVGFGVLMLWKGCKYSCG